MELETAPGPDVSLATTAGRIRSRTLLDLIRSSRASADEGTSSFTPTALLRALQREATAILTYVPSRTGPREDMVQEGWLAWHTSIARDPQARWNVVRTVMRRVANHDATLLTGRRAREVPVHSLTLWGGLEYDVAAPVAPRWRSRLAPADWRAVRDWLRRMLTPRQYAVMEALLCRHRCRAEIGAEFGLTDHQIADAVRRARVVLRRYVRQMEPLRT